MRRLTREILVLSAQLAAVTALGAQTPALLRDVNTLQPPEPSSWPGQMVAFQGFAYFEAETPLAGRELFRTDGTAAGTTLFLELVPGVEGGRAYDFEVAGGRLFFAAGDRTHGEELWVTDGTTAGTRRVADLAPGAADSSPFELTEFGGGVVFRARLPAMGIELFASDGTAGGTRILRDIVPGTSSSLPEHLTMVGSRVVFVANDGVHGEEPWVTDGTAAGTRLLVDAFAGSTGSLAEPLAVIGGRLVFRVANGAHPLWITDGTPGGTAPIPTTLAGVRHTRAVLGGVLLFAGYEPATGEELWRTDGTRVGTFRVADLVPGSGSCEPWLLGMANGRALLRVQRGGVDELWVSDGTTTGTSLVAALDAWPDSGIELGGALYFRAEDNANGEELWRSDGTAAGTRLVADAWPGSRGSVPGHWARLGNRIVFAARDVLGGEPWITDGTAAGTRGIVNLAANPPAWTDDSDPTDGVGWNGSLVFAATTASTEPWISDGTPAGTQRYHAFPGVAPFQQLNENGNPRLHEVRGELVSLVGSPPTVEVWLDRGSGPVQVSSLTLGTGSRPVESTAVANGVLWLASDDLWRIDRGVATRVPIASGGPSFPRLLTRVGAAVLCVAYDGASHGVYRCDAAGCVRLVAFGSFDPVGERMVAAGMHGFFTARSAAHGHELWVTDGTAAGTAVLDLVPGSTGSDPVPLADYGASLLFLADDGLLGHEIWLTAGTVNTTFRLTDLPGNVDPFAFRLLRVGLDRFLFAHDDSVHGREVWQLTSAGASLAVDVVPGAAGSVARWLGVAGEHAYFESRGGELWRTDGTLAGTVRLMAAFDSAGWFAVLGDAAFFDHDDGVVGREPWIVETGATSTQVGAGCGVGMRAPWLRAADPVIGSSWELRGGGGPTGSIGLIVLGRPAVRPTLLPGGCTSRVDAGSMAILHAVPNAAAQWTHVVPLPRIPALAGIDLMAQLWVGPSVNPAGVELSPGVHATLGTW